MKNKEELIVIVVGPGITKDESDQLVQEEIKLWDEKQKELARIEINEDENGDIVIKTTEKSPVRRVRRITGYLSGMENFNDAKQDELAQRYKHYRD